jgi:hypothetical protein
MEYDQAIKEYQEVIEPVLVCARITRQIHSDAQKRRSFLALLFAACDLQRWAYE